MQRVLRVIAATLVVTTALGALHVSSAWADDSVAPPGLRLPADVVSPVRYRLDLTVIPDQDTFTGTVEIDLQFAKSARVLWLNAEKLTLKEATLTVDSERLAAKVIPEAKDYVGFAFEHPVGPGEATFRATYQGEISRKDMEGIFQVKDGDRWYVYSQFEWTFARRAFPCFDEPSYKVPWQLTLHVKKDEVALSNTSITSETNSGDSMKTVKFAQTRPLPSYLVALSVGDLDLVDAGTAGKKNTRIRIAVPRGRGAEAKYAAETTPAILNLLEDYFGISYPYEKLDEVAVPLFGGAMENAGQVTYGASVILAKPEQDSLERQRLWVSIASHELAHQWFGDLVTTAWWDDIWLNEGFADWMANKIVAEYHPEWRTNAEAVNATQGAMGNDALVTARRVRQPIESNDDIANTADQITYNKGAALLHMFESYMGPERFRVGVRRYLAKHAWKNGTSADFLTALAGDDTTIFPAFSSFLDQPGVPLITAGLDCSGGTPKLELSQQRFLPLGSTDVAAHLWKIPVCVRYHAASAEARECTLLDRPSSGMPLSKASGCPVWLEANAGADGYYRVLYQGDLLNALLKDEARPLTLAEKVALVGDILALTRNGKIPLGKALALTPALARDSDRYVVTQTMTITTDLQDRVVAAEFLPNYRRYLEDLYGARAHQLGWKAKPGERDDDRLLRPAVLEVVANQAEDAKLIAQAKALALDWLADHKALDPDMISTVLETAARHGDRALFDRMRAAADQEKNEDIQWSLLTSMGLFPEPEIDKEAFSIVLTNEVDPRQSLGILQGARGSPRTRELAYDFVKQNADKIVTKVPNFFIFSTGAILPTAANGFCDEQHRQDAASFFTARSTKYTGGPRFLAQTLERIDLCIAYKKVQQPSVTEFLQRYSNAN
ncbi:MAG: M1 family aminopeptidase [Terriglobia bacterium]